MIRERVVKMEILSGSRKRGEPSRALDLRVRSQQRANGPKV